MNPVLPILKWEDDGGNIYHRKIFSNLEGEKGVLPFLREEKGLSDDELDKIRELVHNRDFEAFEVPITLEDEELLLFIAEV